jgi:soluble lytic murein transglycosylase-like protein
MKTGVSQKGAAMPQRKKAAGGVRGVSLAAALGLVAAGFIGGAILAPVAQAASLGTLSSEDLARIPSPETQPAAARIWSPEVLSGTDRERYLKIFAAQKRADWKKADKLIAELSDRRLLAYVLADRYLSARYKPKYAELKAWMARYSSIPGADKIFHLALKKKPKKAAAPERPAPQQFRQPAHAAYSVGDGDEAVLSERFTKIDARVRELVRDAKAADALHYLDTASMRMALSDVEYDKVRERIACSFFIENDNERAYQVADEISRRHPREVPMADWYAGLAAWRMEHYSDAAWHFERLARSETVTDWSRAAGGFWAARAYLANRQPDRVAEMLETAADTGATFYGLLAARQLGREPHFNWVEPKLHRAGYEALVTDAAVARAVALVQIGRRDLAEQELVRAHGWLDPSLDESLIALASSFNLPAVELQVANAADLPPLRLKDGEITVNAGLFPIPNYEPADGYRVDRALFFAFMRQESKFRPDVTSPAGARGLMQIMPGTASHIMRDTTLASANKDKLLDPSFNLTLAQQYLETLMGSGEPRGNLFMLTTAYNGGPGNLNRWLDSINFKGDPFLFIESIPAPETRGYIERVLTNFWIYRARLGQPMHSLDATASGDWPVYDAADTSGGSLSLR